MLKDEMLIIRNVPVGTGDCRIMALSDVHVGSKEFDEELFFKWKASIKPTDLIVLVGDLMDNGIKSSVSNTYQQTMMPSAQREWLYRELKDLAPQILCSVGGNHDSRRNRKEVDEDPNYSLMCLLRREEVYRSGACFCKVRFGNKVGRAKQASTDRPVYNIAVLHGSAGGMYVSTSGSKTERFNMAISNCDLLITGHTHKPLTFPTSHICFPDNNQKAMSKRQTTVVVCSSFVTKLGGYALEKMMPPTSNVYQEILLSPKGKRIKVIHSTGD